LFHITPQLFSELLRAFAQVRLVSFAYRNSMEKGKLYYSMYSPLAFFSQPLVRALDVDVNGRRNQTGCKTNDHERYDVTNDSQN
jgi:hypothetical protein